MNWCQRIADWIRDNIERRIAQVLQDWYRACIELRNWVQRTIRNPLETLLRRLQQQCREQQCNWWCLCCNKWFCWLIDLLLRLVVWIVRIFWEWLLELFCRLLLIIFTLIITIIIQVLKWVVLAIVCLLTAMCSFIFLLAGIALIAVLLSLVALAAPPVAAIGTAIVPIALTVAVVSFLMAKLLCEAGRCRLLGVLAWALKWSITLGAILTVVLLSPLSAFVVVLMGGSLAALMTLMEQLGCRVPRMFGVP